LLKVDVFDFDFLSDPVLSLMYKIVKRTMILILLKPVVKYEFLSIKLRFFSLKYAFLSLKSMYKLNISVQNTNLQTNQGK